MAEERAGGVTRRRVLQGAVWSAPAVLIATSASAATASVDPVEGIEFQNFLPQFAPYFWDATAGATIAVVTVAAYLQNLPLPPGSASDINTLDYTVTVPVGTVPVESQHWGIGSNSQGIPGTPPIDVISGPTYDGENVTITFRWMGTMPTYDGRYVMVWFQAQSGQSQLGKNGQGIAVATHADSDSSQDTAVEPIVAITNVNQWRSYFWEFTPPPAVPVGTITYNRSSPTAGTGSIVISRANNATVEKIRALTVVITIDKVASGANNYLAVGGNIGTEPGWTLQTPVVGAEAGSAAQAVATLTWDGTAVGASDLTSEVSTVVSFNISNAVRIVSAVASGTAASGAAVPETALAVSNTGG